MGRPGGCTGATAERGRSPRDPSAQRTLGRLLIGGAVQRLGEFFVEFGQDVLGEAAACHALHGVLDGGQFPLDVAPVRGVRELTQVSGGLFGGPGEDGVFLEGVTLQQVLVGREHRGDVAVGHRVLLVVQRGDVVERGLGVFGGAPHGQVGAAREGGGHPVDAGDGCGGPVLCVLVVDVGDLWLGPRTFDEHADLAVGEVGVGALDLVDPDAGGGGVAVQGQVCVELQGFRGGAGVELTDPLIVLLDGEFTVVGPHEAGDAVDEVGGCGEAGYFVLVLDVFGDLEQFVPGLGGFVAQFVERVGVVPECAYTAVPRDAVVGVVEGAVGVCALQQVVAALPVLDELCDSVVGFGVGPGGDLVVTDFDDVGAAADHRGLETLGELPPGDPLDVDLGVGVKLLVLFGDRVHELVLFFTGVAHPPHREGVGCLAGASGVVAGAASAGRCEQHQGAGCGDLRESHVYLSLRTVCRDASPVLEPA